MYPSVRSWPHWLFLLIQVSARKFSFLKQFFWLAALLPCFICFLSPHPGFYCFANLQQPSDLILLLHLFIIHLPLEGGLHESRDLVCIVKGWKSSTKNKNIRTSDLDPVNLGKYLLKKLKKYRGTGSPMTWFSLQLYSSLNLRPLSNPLMLRAWILCPRNGYMKHMCFCSALLHPWWASLVDLVTFPPSHMGLTFFVNTALQAATIKTLLMASEIRRFLPPLH